MKEVTVMKKRKSLRFVFILSLVMGALVMGGSLSTLSAESSNIDWNKYDKYYDYTEKSPWLAVAVSVIPVWSGSFNARFNAGGVYRVLFKSSMAALAITSYVKGPVGVGWQYWAGTMGVVAIYDMVKSYDFVRVANKQYASLSLSPRLYCSSDDAGEQGTAVPEKYRFEGLNLSAIYRF